MSRHYFRLTQGGVPFSLPSIDITETALPRQFDIGTSEPNDVVLCGELEA